VPSILHPAHPEHAPRRLRPGEVRWMMGRNIWTGVLGNIGLMYMTGGVFFVAYCHEMGMEKYQFGVLRALSSLVVPLMLLSPAIEERCGRRKYPWFVLQLAGRFMLFPLVLGIFFRINPWMIVSLVGLYSALSSVGTALWQSWTWDYIPLAVYARFSARRTFWIRLTGTMFFVVAAAVVGLTQSDTLMRRQLLSAIFVLLFVLAILDIVFHVRIPEPHRRSRRAGTFAKFVEALKNVPFRNWLVLTAIWNFAVSLAGPFCMPYMMEELGFGDRLFMASVLTSLVPTIGALATLPLWGRLLDTRHTGRVVALCCAVWSLIPLLFFYATDSNAMWMMGAVWTISGIFPTAVTVAIPLITARLSGAEKTAPAALRLVLMSVGAASGAALGTLILRTYGVHHAFMASFAARMTVVFLMFLMLDVRPAHVERAERRAAGATWGGTA